MTKKHDHAPSKSALYFDFPTEYIIYHNITLEKFSCCAHVYHKMDSYQ